MVHVEDLCDLALLAAESPQAPGRCYIAADAHPVSTRALYEGLLEAMGRKVPGWRVPAGLLRLAWRAGDLGAALLRRPLPVGSEAVSRLLDSACYSGQRAMKELGWQPRHDLLSSLPEMVYAWHEKAGSTSKIR
jgi:nucleoside-diphosphate-sugar epimerase